MYNTVIKFIIITIIIIILFAIHTTYMQTTLSLTNHSYSFYKTNTNYSFPSPIPSRRKKRKKNCYDTKDPEAPSNCALKSFFFYYPNALSNVQFRISIAP